MKKSSSFRLKGRALSSVCLVEYPFKKTRERSSVRESGKSALREALEQAVEAFLRIYEDPASKTTEENIVCVCVNKAKVEQ